MLEMAGALPPLAEVAPAPLARSEGLDRDSKKYALDAISRIAKLPRLGGGSATEKPVKLRSWLWSVDELLRATTSDVCELWDWAKEQAGGLHSYWGASDPLRRPMLEMQTRTPLRWSDLERRLRPLVVASLPDRFAKELQHRGQLGRIEELHGILYMVYREFQPGSKADRVGLLEHAQNPRECTTVRESARELKNWKVSLARALEYGIAKPDLVLRWNALQRIIAPALHINPTVSFKNEATLLALHLPDQLSEPSLAAYIRFVEAVTLQAENEDLATAGVWTLQVGRGWNNANDYFTGAVDEIYVYDEARTADEILSLIHI